ncbi:MAG: hypothetical protein J6Y16_09945 [Treponema sp.]|nr:hypothetical protein [Treponema sp.]
MAFKIIGNDITKVHADAIVNTANPLPKEAFMEGQDFEDVIRTAVSLGGDSDTLTDIAAAMGEAFYGLPQEFKELAFKYTTEDMHEVMKSFDEKAIARKGLDIYR